MELQRVAQIDMKALQQYNEPSAQFIPNSVSLRWLGPQIACKFDFNYLHVEIDTALHMV